MASDHTVVASVIDSTIGSHSRIMLGDDQYTPEQMAAMPPVRWPLVQLHDR